ncbi:MAG TPA: DegQ family serine endoprotease [Opitutaceae bacterium]|nr:DegQ family serine endoprotease [Opitutaceae bacterium]
MHKPNQPSLRRRLLALTACAFLAGGTTWVVAESKNETKAPVTVKVDSAPLQRTNDSSYSPIVKRVAPAVVKVVTREKAKEIEMTRGGGGSPFDDPRFREFFGLPPAEPGSPNRRMQRPPQQQGLGSGVIVSSDGYILTNNHVVAGADNVKITLSDGRELTAKVVGTDEKTDVAVLKIEAKNLSPVTFADSNDVQVGDRVLAVGNPFGLGQTVTTGIVSATGRAVSLGVDYADFIQTDAAINPGNSGGALIDMQGRLIGINTAILSRTGGFQGIGFAIPADLARYVMDSIVQDGKVTRGFLGVSIQDLTPALAESFNRKNTQGALVRDVTEDSPAAKAGIQSGDILLEVNGKPVADSQRLRFAVAEVRPGAEANLKLVREGKEQTVKVTVGDQPGEQRLSGTGGPAAKDEGSLNGVGVTDLTPAARGEFDIPASVRGALVTQVDPDSPSAAAGLNPGDVIQEINGKAVRTSEEAIKLTEKTETGKTRLKLWSRGGTHYLIVDETEAAAAKR